METTPRKEAGEEVEVDRERGFGRSSGALRRNYLRSQRRDRGDFTSSCRLNVCCDKTFKQAAQGQ